MNEPRQTQSSRPLCPLISLLATILVIGIVLTQVDISKLISPLLAGKRPGSPGYSAVMAMMLVVLIGLPALALGLLVRANFKRAKSSPVREEGEAGP